MTSSRNIFTFVILACSICGCDLEKVFSPTHSNPPIPDNIVEFQYPTFDFSGSYIVVGWNPLLSDSSVDSVNSKTGIWKISIDGTERKLLLEAQAISYPSLSKDGTSLLYDLNGQICVTNIITLETITIPTFGYCIYPHFSNDCKKILFISDYNIDGYSHYNPWTISLEGSYLQPIIWTRNKNLSYLLPQAGIYANWSNDDRSIVFLHSQKGIAKVDTTGDNYQLLLKLSNNMDIKHLSYSPSEEHILYYSERYLWTINENTLEVEQLTASWGFPSWSPDGESILHIYKDPDDNTAAVWIYTLQNEENILIIQ